MSFDWRRSAVAALASLVVLAPLGLVAEAASAAAPTSAIVINEVESNGGTPVDWVELKNTGTTSVDVSGYILRDNKDTDAVAIAAGTTIAPGGYLAVDVDITGGYGLGGADNARLFLPDGTTLLDSYEWSVHATTTYGRCADGTGDFTTTASSTKGAANDCAPTTVPTSSPTPTTTPTSSPTAAPSSGVVINEVESNGGTPVDWVELKNTGTTSVDVSGYILRDNKDTDAVAIAAGTTVAPGGYLAVDVDITGGYGLGAADNARLFLPDGTTLVDSYTWAAHATTTYGRCADGTGEFTTTLFSTKGAANACVPSDAIKINEVESSGGTPGDWIELTNIGPASVDLSGWILRDNKDTDAVAIAAGTSIAPGGYLAVDVDITGGYGLGSADNARLFLANGTTLVDSYDWTTHAATTYGRCPDGTGAFKLTAASTKAAANMCEIAPVTGLVINEVKTAAGTDLGWIEITNPTSAAVDASGFVLKDSDNTHSQTIPAGTTVAAGAYVAFDTTFALDSADSARLFAVGGTALVDSYSWTSAAATSYGRSPNGTGTFTTTFPATKGAANEFGVTWPGSSTVKTVDDAALVTSNLSGLDYDTTSATGPLWAVQNGPGTLFRLVKNDAGNWVSDTANGWSAGKTLLYTDGTPDPDSEGVTSVSDAGAWSGIYTSTERNNANNGVSRPSILRYDTSATGTSLTATTEWNLTADLPAFGPNLGLEAITYIPDTVLVKQGLADEHTGALYDPATYGDHGEGLFFVGAEQNGMVYAYALKADGSYTRVAAFSSGFTAVMDLQFDAETGHLWAVCDDTCNGRMSVLDIAQSGSTDGHFEVTNQYQRPAGMGNFNNEGFALAPQQLCVDGSKPVFWADDTDDAGFSLREGTIDCTGAVVPITGATPTITGSAVFGETLTADAGTWSPAPVELSYQWLRDGTAIEGATEKTFSPAASDIGKSISVAVTGTKVGSEPVTLTSAASVVLAATFTTSTVPTISGTATVGSTLKATAGTWVPAATALTYQWKRNGVDIAGATSATRKLTKDDASKRISVAVTGAREGYTSVARTSSSTATVTSVFTHTAAATIKGTAKVGKTLTAKTGSWSPRPTFSYRWYVNGKPVAKATHSTYKLKKSIVGKKVTVKITAKKSGYVTVIKTSASKKVAK